MMKTIVHLASLAILSLATGCVSLVKPGSPIEIQVPSAYQSGQDIGAAWAISEQKLPDDLRDASILAYEGMTLLIEQNRLPTQLMIRECILHIAENNDWGRESTLLAVALADRIGGRVQIQITELDTDGEKMQWIRDFKKGIDDAIEDYNQLVTGFSD